MAALQIASGDGGEARAAKADDLDDAIAKVKAEARRSEEKARALAEKLGDLQAEVERLMAENQELKARADDGAATSRQAEAARIGYGVASQMKSMAQGRGGMAQGAAGWPRARRARRPDDRQHGNGGRPRGDCQRRRGLEWDWLLLRRPRGRGDEWGPGAWARPACTARAGPTAR